MSQPEIIEKTRSLLAQHVKTTPLTDKLLSRPPFKYLHDLIMEVCTVSGYAGDLFEDRERDASQVADKDSKIAFLSKLIDRVSRDSGVEIVAKPAKIVAGLDADDTNAFLQAFAMAAASGPASAKKSNHSIEIVKVKESVQPIQQEQRMPSISIDRTEPEQAVEAPKPSGPRKSISIALSNVLDIPKPEGRRKSSVSVEPTEESPVAKGPRKSISVPTPEPAIETTSPSESKHVPVLKSPISNSSAAAKDSTASSSDSLKNSRPGSGTALRKPISDKKKSSPLAEQGSKDSKPPQLGQSGAPPVKRPTTSDPFAPPRPTTSAGKSQPAKPVDRSQELKQSTASPAESQSGSANVLSTNPSKQKVADSTPNTMQIETPKPILESNTASSAIKESKADNMETDDSFFILQSTPIAQVEKPVEDVLSTAAGMGHGGLVRKIVETNKSLTTNKTSATDANIEALQTSRLKERQTLTKEIRTLKTTIQEITRHAAPLNQLLDYFQEDLDAMAKEMDSWKQERIKYTVEHEKEKQETQRLLAPLKTQLTTLDEQIAEKISKIDETKAKLAENEVVLVKLIGNMVGANNVAQQGVRI